MKNSPVLLSLLRIILSFWRIFPDAYLLQGKQKKNEFFLSVAIVGDEETVEYISSVLYDTKPHKIKIGKVFLFAIAYRKSYRILSKADLVFIKLSLFCSGLLSRKDYFLIPEWITFVLKTSLCFKNFEKRNKESLRSDIRKIVRNNYSYEVTTDMNKFDLFYKKMYLPYIFARHGQSAILWSYNALKYYFLKGRLLLLKQDNRYISGVILVPKNQKLLFLALGLIEEGSILKDGGVSALYYFTIQWAKDNGYKWVDFGSARPVLEDGLFRYKRKWNMEIRRHRIDLSRFALKIQNLNKNVKEALSKFPFILNDEGQLRALFFIDEEVSNCGEKIAKLYRKYRTLGLDKIYAISFSGFSNNTVEYIKSRNLEGLELQEFKKIKLYA